MHELAIRRHFLWLLVFLALVAASWNTYLVGEFNDDVCYIALDRVVGHRAGHS